MPLDVRLFPCRTDNYGFLARDAASGQVAAVDAPDAEAILRDLQMSGWERLDLLLITHWHPDHTEGAERLKAETGCEVVGPQEAARVTALDRVLSDGDRAGLGDTIFEAMHAPGHTLGHIVLHASGAGVAFVGDVLFPLGCGRLFEGTPEQMYASLKAIAALPEETVLYAAHEYAASNARFALTVDDRPELKSHAERLLAMRERGEPTVPTTVAAEKAFNPFLTAENVETFAARRAAKDTF